MTITLYCAHINYTHHSQSIYKWWYQWCQCTNQSSQLTKCDHHQYQLQVWMVNTSTTTIFSWPWPYTVPTATIHTIHTPFISTGTVPVIEPVTVQTNSETLKQSIHWCDYSTIMVWMVVFLTKHLHTHPLWLKISFTVIIQVVVPVVALYHSKFTAN